MSLLEESGISIPALPLPVKSNTSSLELVTSGCQQCCLRQQHDAMGALLPSKPQPLITSHFFSTLLGKARWYLFLGEGSYHLFPRTWPQGRCFLCLVHTYSSLSTIKPDMGMSKACNRNYLRLIQKDLCSDQETPQEIINQ